MTRTIPSTLQLPDKREPSDERSKAASEIQLWPVPMQQRHEATRSVLGPIDTGNYDPVRNGSIDAWDGLIADAQSVAQRFARHMVKPSNSISVNSLRSKGSPAGRRPRIALPVPSNDGQAKQVAFTLVEDAGFTLVGAGLLAGPWRHIAHFRGRPD